MTIPQFKRHLQAALRWCQNHEDHDEAICHDGANILREARRKANQAGLPEVSSLLTCPSDMLAPIAAQGYLAAALAALPSDKLLSVPEVAQRLRVSPATVRKWIASGELKATNTGGQRKRHRVSPDALAEFGKPVKQQPRPKPQSGLLVQRYKANREHGS